MNHWKVTGALWAFATVAVILARILIATKPEPALEDTGVDGGTPDGGVDTAVLAARYYANAKWFSFRGGKTHDECMWLGVPNDAGQFFMSDWKCKESVYRPIFPEPYDTQMQLLQFIEVLASGRCKPTDGGRICTP